MAWKILQKIKNIPVYLPLRFKIMGSFIATLFLFSVFIFTFYPFIERQHLNQDVKNKYLSRGTMLAFDLGEGKMMMDSNLIKRALQIAKQDSEFTYIAVKNTNGKLLYQYNPRKINNLKIFSSKHGFFQYQDNHYYSETFPVITGHSNYGTLQIAGSLEHHYLLIHKSILISLFVSLFILLVGFFISYFFSRKVTTPLSQLQKATEKIIEGNFDEIVPSDSTDEIGALGQSFNEMEATVRQLINDLNKEVRVSKESEKALRDSETQLTTLIETIPELIWVKNPERKYVWYNNKFEEFFEIPAKSWIGKTDNEINSSNNTALYEETDQEVISKGITVHFEEQISLKGSKTAEFLNVIKTPLKNSNGDLIGILGIGQDITSGKQTEDDLRNARAHLQTLINTIPDSVWLKDTEGRYLTCNAMFEKVSGLTEKKLAGKTDYDFYDSKMADFFTQSDNEVLNSKKRVHFEHRGIIKETGSPIIADTIKTPMFDNHGAVIGVLGVAHDITVQKEMEEALRTSETHLKALIHTIPDPVWLKDKNGRFLRCNAAFEEMNGVEEAQIIGKTDHDFSPRKQADLFSRTDHQVLDTKKPVQFENQSFSKKLGKEIIIEIIKAPLLNSDGEAVGVLGIARDITSRKLSEEKLSDERTLLRTIIDLIPDAIYVKDTMGRKILANPKEVTLSGKNTEDEVLGKTDNELYNEWNSMQFFEEDKQILEQGTSILDYESELTDNTGKKHWLIGFKAPLLNTKREIIGIVGLNHDITERKLAEQEVQKRNLELAKINAEKDKFFSIIAHDLRGPFSNFMGLTEMMVEKLQDMSQEQLQEMATAMNTSASKLYGLLENLLQWSRSQRNTITFEPKLMKLSNLVDKSLKPLIDSAIKKELIFEKSIPENITIFADTNMMETVIRNLFSNALKFTPRKGKVSIVASSKNAKWIDVAIQDTGIGMDKNLLAELFTLSSHTGRKGTEGEPSSGLGLILCKEFVEKNGGTLWVESKENEGSTFIFTVPTNQNSHKNPKRED